VQPNKDVVNQRWPNINTSNKSSSSSSSHDADGETTLSEKLLYTSFMTFDLQAYLHLSPLEDEHGYNGAP